MLVATAIGAWADGTVTLTPNPSGTIEFNLTDDAGGKTFALSGGFITSAPHNVTPQVVYVENDSEATDIVTCSWDANNKVITIIPNAVTPEPVNLRIKVQGPGWTPETTGVDYSASFSLYINNEQKIPATLTIPSSIRIGNSGTASVSVAGSTLGTDYIVEYSTNNAGVLEVAADGTLIPVAAGNATITAVVTPTASGNATAYVAKTLTTDVTVSAAINANWTGSIVNTTLPLGVQTTQSSDYPQVTWSETIAGATTQYTVVSSDESIIKGHFNLQDNNPTALVLASLKAGKANVSIKAEYGYWEYPNNVATWIPITEKISEPTEITIESVVGTLKVTPSDDISMDITDPAKSLVVTGSWADGTGVDYSVVSSASDVVKAELEYGGETSVKITPLKVGTSTITVKNTWTKALNHPYSESATVEETVTFNVTVIDKTLATSLSVPSSVEVAKGYSTELDVTFAPETANGFTWSTTGNSGVSATLSADFKTLTISATEEASTSETATVTITPKAGSSAEAVNVTVNVVNPIPVSEVAFESESITLAKGTKENVVATVDPLNAANTKINYTVADNTVVSYNNGVLTALKHGTTTITATSVMDNTKTDVLTVNVTDQLPIILGKPRNRYVVGTVYDADLTVGDDLVLGEDYTASYTSSNSAVLSVDNSGTLSAHKVGTTKISVVYTPTAQGTAKGYTEWSNFLDITVDKGKFDLAVSAGDNSLESGESTTITPTVKLGGSVADADLYTISYSSDNDDVEVSDAGVVTVKSDATQGTAHITVTLKPTNTADYETTSVDVLIAYGYSATGTGAIATLASDGFVELFIPSPGAYGKVENYVATRTYSVGDDAIVKDASKIRITGYISNEDMQAFSALVGGNVSKLVTLDMGGAKMSEAIEETSPSDGGRNISFIQPGTPRTNDMNVLCNLAELTMPQPADNVENGTKIPDNFWKWFKPNDVSPLANLVITEGWTEIGDNAFSSGGSIGNLTEVKFPNTIEVIGVYAFSGHRFTALTLPKTITELKSGAFETKKPNTLKDVYFLGEYAPIVHKDAFATITHIANDSFVHPRDFAQTDVYNYNQCVRENYYDSQNGWCAKLHYPASLLEPGKEHLRDLYVDPYRVYSCTNRYEKENNTSTLNSANKSPETADWTIDLIKGDKIVLNENAAFSSVSDFASKVQSADFCAGMIPNADNEIEPGFYDKAIGTQYVWPSQQQFLRAYGSTRNGYFYTGVEMDEEQKQRIGLYEFIFTDPDVNNESTTGWTFPGSYEQDLWWTICVPFNMSVEQIKAVFGPNTEVCRFSKVVRTLADNGTVGKLRLEFKNSVMGETDEDGTPLNWGNGNEDGSLGILAHHPYMIYPSGETEELYKLDGKRYFPNYTVVDGDVTGETITAVDLAETPNEVEVNKPYDIAKGDGYVHKDSQPARYTFIGNYMAKVNIPQYAYYLGLNNGVDRTHSNYHQFYFNNASTPLAFNPYTCIVYNNFGEYDNYDYFDGAEPETALAKSIFGVEMDNDFEATGVKNIEIVCGNNNDNKVYNLKGQLVNGNLENLPSGVYVVNGKKYIK